MSRAARLLALMQALRRRRHPVSGAELAQELGISLRTLYRDIAELQAQGAEISGEAGVGYVLRPGFLLPPLMFAAEELEALMLGMRWVAERGDAALAQAARNALAKVAAVLPPDLRDSLAQTGLLVGPGDSLQATVDPGLIRQAIREERRLALAYTDRDGEASRRVVRPVALGFFDRALLLVAWCELRQDFRHFRMDRMVSAELLPGRYPQRRAALLKQWRETEGIELSDIWP
jgi:predicted DNA-binding transcriptional regulator YafY